tara:strand:+ start:60 stop:371 length:312 start_codon:yes stop_codon:yes gene_type:complete
MFLTTKLNLIVTNNGKDYHELPANSNINLLNVEDFYDRANDIIYYKLNCKNISGGFIINCKRYSKESDLIVRNSGYNSVYLNDYFREWNDVFKEEVPDILRVK